MATHTQTTDRSFPLIPFAGLLLGGMAIGFGGILVRWCDVNPVASAFWRMALAAPLLWAWAFAVQRQDNAQGKRTDFTVVLLLAGLFFAGDLGVWHLSLFYTTVANATLLSNLAPLFVTLWAWGIQKERIRLLFLAGMAAALTGAGMLVGPNAALGGDRLLGDGLGFTTAFLYAAYQVTVKDARSRYSTARLMAWSSTLTALAQLPFALSMPGRFFPASAAGWQTLLLLAFVAQIGGQTVIAYAFAHLPAALSSVSLLIQPLTAAVAAWILLQETLGPLQIAGGVLILFGIYLSRRGQGS